RPGNISPFPSAMPESRRARGHTYVSFGRRSTCQKIISGRLAKRRFLRDRRRSCQAKPTGNSFQSTRGVRKAPVGQTSLESAGKLIEVGLQRNTASDTGNRESAVQANLAVFVIQKPLQRRDRCACLSAKISNNPRGSDP